MNKKLLAALFGTVLMVSACGGGDEVEEGEEAPMTETDDEAGGEVTQASDAESLITKGNCVTCHGGNLEGAGPNPSLNDVGSRLSEEEILHVIQNGQGSMPGNLLEGTEAEVVAEWLAQQKE